MSKAESQHRDIPAEIFSHSLMKKCLVICRILLKNNCVVFCNASLKKKNSELSPVKEEYSLHTPQPTLRCKRVTLGKFCFNFKLEAVDDNANPI